MRRLWDIIQAHKKVSSKGGSERHRHREGKFSIRLITTLDTEKSLTPNTEIIG